MDSRAVRHPHLRHRRKVESMAPVSANKRHRAPPPHHPRPAARHVPLLSRQLLRGGRPSQDTVERGEHLAVGRPAAELLCLIRPRLPARHTASSDGARVVGRPYPDPSEGEPGLVAGLLIALEPIDDYAAGSRGTVEPPNPASDLVPAPADRQRQRRPIGPSDHQAPRLHRCWHAAPRARLLGARPGRSSPGDAPLRNAAAGHLDNERRRPLPRTAPRAFTRPFGQQSVGQPAASE